MEHKTLAVTDAKIGGDGPGSFTGYASLFGVLDSQGDVVLHGAYAATLPQFKERGFIAWSHDWTDPVATIRDAYEDDRGLYVIADFHSDPASQQARTRTLERIERGKFVGLSIGYQVADAAYSDDGARLLKAIDLYETSLVTVPALRDAGVTAAKAIAVATTADPDDMLTEALKAFTDALTELKEGRMISEARRGRLGTLRDQLRSGADDLDGLLLETAPKAAGDDGQAARRALVDFQHWLFENPHLAS